MGGSANRYLKKEGARCDGKVAIRHDGRATMRRDSRATTNAMIGRQQGANNQCDFENSKAQVAKTMPTTRHEQ